MVQLQLNSTDSSSAINSKWFLAATACSLNLKMILKRRRIIDYELYIGAGLDHRLDTIYTNRSFAKVKRSYTNPNQEPGIDGISLYEVEKPMELGSKNNLFPCCLLDFYVSGTFGKFQFAGFGMTQMIYGTLGNYQKKEEITDEDPSLLLINDLEQVECEKRLICARSTLETAVCHLDQGGGLLHEFCDKAYVVGILTDSSRENDHFCTYGSTTEYSPVYENLDWISDHVQEERCFTPNPMRYPVLFVLFILISACFFLMSLIIYSMRAYIVLNTDAPDSASSSSSASSSGSPCPSPDESPRESAVESVKVEQPRSKSRPRPLWNLIPLLRK